MGNATSLSIEGLRSVRPEEVSEDEVRIESSDTSSLTLQNDIDDADCLKDEEVVPSDNEDDEEQGVMLSQWKVFNAYDRKAMQLASLKRANDNALSSGGRHRGTKEAAAEVPLRGESRTLRIADLDIPEELELVEFMADVEAFAADADAAADESEGWPGYQSRMKLHLDAAKERRLAAERRESITGAAGRVRRGRVSKKERRNPYERVNEHGHIVHRAH